jgi:hypothetical protein
MLHERYSFGKDDGDRMSGETAKRPTKGEQKFDAHSSDTKSKRMKRLNESLHPSSFRLQTPYLD